MDYSIEVVRGQHFIRVTAKGDLTRENALKMNEEAHQVGKDNGINQYLVDVREARNVESVTNNYKIAYKDMQKEMFDRNAKVAFLTHQDDHSHDFVEMVFRNAGFNVRLFREKEKALAFLSE